MFEVLNASRADCDEHIDIDYIYCGSGVAFKQFQSRGTGRVAAGQPQRQFAKWTLGQFCCLE